jgi:hypothetical protein
LANATYGETPPETMRILLRELASEHNNHHPNDKHNHNNATNNNSTFAGRFIDAGSGNGVATVTAAIDGRFARCLGIEYDEGRTRLANQLKVAYDQQHQHKTRLDFVCADLASESLSGASVVYANSVVRDADLCATFARQLERRRLDTPCHRC